MCSYFCELFNAHSIYFDDSVKILDRLVIICSYSDPLIALNWNRILCTYCHSQKILDESNNIYQLARKKSHGIDNLLKRFQFIPSRQLYIQSLDHFLTETHVTVLQFGRVYLSNLKPAHVIGRYDFNLIDEYYISEKTRRQEDKWYILG